MRATSGRTREDLPMILIRRQISAAKFIDGGALIFAQSEMKSRRDRKGEIAYIPLVRTSLRVLVDSYMELADAKSVDEANPCATIIVRVPVNLHVDGRKTAIRSKPIWLTDA